MGFTIMVDIIEMVSTIMGIDVLDMVIIIQMEIDIIREDAIGHVMVYMDTIEIKIIINVLSVISQDRET